MPVPIFTFIVCKGPAEVPTWMHGIDVHPPGSTVAYVIVGVAIVMVGDTGGVGVADPGGLYPNTKRYVPGMQPDPLPAMLVPPTVTFSVPALVPAPIVAVTAHDATARRVEATVTVTCAVSTT